MSTITNPSIGGWDPLGNVFRTRGEQYLHELGGPLTNNQAPRCTHAAQRLWSVVTVEMNGSDDPKRWQRFVITICPVCDVPNRAEA